MHYSQVLQHYSWGPSVSASGSGMCTVQYGSSGRPAGRAADWDVRFPGAGGAAAGCNLAAGGARCCKPPPATQPATHRRRPLLPLPSPLCM